MKQRRPPAENPAAASELDRMCRALGGIEDPFDEVGIARAEARLLAALTDGTERARRRWSTTSRRIGVAVGLAAAIAAAAGVVLWSGQLTAPAFRQLARLEPYVVAPIGGVAAGAAAAVPAGLTEPASRWAVPAGWLVRARLGERAKVTIVGPARLTVEGAGPLAQITLSQGELLGELEGGAGQQLRIVTADAVATVVGTLFAVQAVGGASRISVSHGRVQVVTSTSTRNVETGQSWLTTSDSTGTLAPATADALADHHRIAAPAGASVPLAVAGAPVAADVWIGQERVAAAPAWLRVEGRSEVRLSAPGYPDAVWRLPAPDAQEVRDDVAGAAPRPLRVSLPPTTRADPPPPAVGGDDAGGVPTPSRGMPAAPPAAAPKHHHLTGRTVASRDDGAARAEASSEPTTAAALYQRADAAQAAGDRDGARAALRALVEQFPRDALADPAHYELALMAHVTGDEAAVLADLSMIADPTLAEPAHYLRCRALLAQRSAAADDCLATFRQRFPRSPHDGDALGALAALRFEAGGCVRMRPALEELERRHPHHASTAAARARCPEVTAGSGSR